MTNQPPNELDNLIPPGYLEFAEFYEQEERRFREEFSPSFELYHDPTQEKEGVDFPVYGKGNFVWRGEVSVRINQAKSRSSQIHTFVVDFVYPDTWPYTPVRVHAVEPELVGYRHQYPRSNALCYLRSSPNDWQPGITNLQILSKVKRWFLGHMTDWRLTRHVDLPEYPIYLPVADQKRIFLFDHCYEFRWNSHGWFEICFDQKAGHGYLDGLFSIPLKSQVSASKDVLDKLFYGSVKDFQTIRGVWFDLSQMPNHFRTAGELLDSIVQNSDFEDVQALIGLIKSLANWSEHKREGIYLGMRYPSVYTRRRQWLVVKLKLPDKPNLTVRPSLSMTERQKLKEEARFRQADLSNVPLYPIRHEDLFRRVVDVHDVDEISQKTVAIIGLGALGSPIVTLLAKAGVGRFILCDGDELVPGNVVRHTCGLESTGVRKSDAQAFLIHRINPYAEIIPYGFIGTRQDTAGVIGLSDLTIVTTGDESFELFVNAVALKLKKSVIYGRGMRQMQVGRVMKVIPGQTACLHCLRLYRERAGELRDSRGGRWFDVVEDAAAFALYDDNCGAPTFPGAAVDTEAIANLIARVAIEHLLGYPEMANHWVWFNSQGKSPRRNHEFQHELQCQQQTFPPLDICEACLPLRISSRQRNGQEQVRAVKYPEVFSQVYIHREAYEHLIQESRQVGQLETGGVLLGYVDSNTNNLVITVSTSPGPEAIHQQSYFLRDRTYCQENIDRCYRESNGAIDYVGEWHKHPISDMALSPMDRRSLIDIAVSENYETNQPVMLICEMPDYQKPEECKLRLFLNRHGDEKIQERTITIIEREDVSKDEDYVEIS
jgi:integrative and conjugative element protein (TIGR02256 family)